MSIVDTITSLGIAGCLLVAASAPQRPTPQITLPCRVVEVIDGDTVEIAIEHRERIRLVDCWAPEVKGAEKAAGDASREHLRKFVEANGPRGVVSWQVDPDGRRWRDQSLGRILGRVWVGESASDLSAVQVEAGHATRVKRE